MSIVPSKLIVIDITTNDASEYWTDPTNPDIWEGSPYRWRISCNVSAQTHSSPNTLTPFYYNGLDIEVGNWVADGNGRCLRIISIESQDESEIVFVGEDIDRFNTYNDPYISGFGGLSSSNGLIFDLTIDGQPDIQSLTPGYFVSEAIVTIRNRFEARNITDDFIRVFQDGNTFAIGDFIELDDANPGEYKLCPSDDINLAVGTVNSLAIPGTGWFTYKPFNEIIEDVTPPLVGNYGDIFYMDPANPGKVTHIKPFLHSKPVYVRLETGSKAIRLNAIVDDSNSESKSLKVVPTQDQTVFVLPADAIVILTMAINGIENTNYTYDPATLTLTFDPIATGYGVDPTDEVIFIYHS